MRSRQTASFLTADARASTMPATSQRDNSFRSTAISGRPVSNRYGIGSRRSAFAWGPPSGSHHRRCVQFPSSPPPHSIRKRSCAGRPDARREAENGVGDERRIRPSCVRTGVWLLPCTKGKRTNTGEPQGGTSPDQQIRNRKPVRTGWRPEVVDRFRSNRERRVTRGGRGPQFKTYSILC